MTDMGFYQELEIIYGQVCIFEGDKEKGIPAEYDRVEVDRVFKWVVFEKKTRSINLRSVYRMKTIAGRFFCCKFGIWNTEMN